MPGVAIISEHTPCPQACLSGVLTILPAAGPDHKAVLGIGFPFTVCTNIWEGRIKRKVKKFWEGHKSKVMLAGIQLQGADLVEAEFCTDK